MPVVTTQELAQAAGVTRQRIYQWKQDGLPGRIGHGKWDSEQALAWIAARREVNGTAEPTSEGLVELRCRLTRAQAEAQELRNGILAGNLLLKDTVENVNREEYAAIIECGDRWVSQGRTAVEQAHRRDCWHALRVELVGAVERLAAHYSRGEDVAAARIRYAGRVG